MCSLILLLYVFFLTLVSFRLSYFIFETLACFNRKWLRLTVFKYMLYGSWFFKLWHSWKCKSNQIKSNTRKYGPHKSAPLAHKMDFCPCRIRCRASIGYHIQRAKLNDEYYREICGFQKSKRTVAFLRDSTQSRQHTSVNR